MENDPDPVSVTGKVGNRYRTAHPRPRAGWKHCAPCSQIYERFATRILPRGSSV